MLKVCKFGGSSLSDAKHFKQVKAIIESDPDRKCVIVSAPGKGEGEHDKITDLLYLCYQHRKYHVEFDGLFERAKIPHHQKRTQYRLSDRERSQ